jgi:pseudouridine kinase
MNRTQNNERRFRKDCPTIVIGAAGVDIVGRLQGELLERSSNPARIRTSFGGVARNVGENLARLGQPVILLTAVGDDWNGEQLIGRAKAAGIDTSFILRKKNVHTGMYIGVLNSNVELLFALDSLEITEYITPTYIRQQSALFKDAGCIFVDMNLKAETLKAVFSLARRYRVPVCADPTSTFLAPKILPYLPDLELITPNAAEAAVLVEPTHRGTSRRQALLHAKRLVSRGVKIVIVTMAEQGLCYATSQTSGYIPAIRTTISDPTGGGDALTAAVIFALLNEIPLDDAVRLGVSAATLTLQYPDTVVPDLTLEKLYDQLVI